MGDCRTVDMHQASQKLEPLRHSAAVSVDTTTRFPTMSTMGFDEQMGTVPSTVLVRSRSLEAHDKQRGPQRRGIAHGLDEVAVVRLPDGPTERKSRGRLRMDGGRRRAGKAGRKRRSNGEASPAFTVSNESDARAGAPPPMLSPAEEPSDSLREYERGRARPAVSPLPALPATLLRSLKVRHKEEESLRMKRSRQRQQGATSAPLSPLPWTTSRGGSPTIWRGASAHGERAARRPVL